METDPLPTRKILIPIDLYGVSRASLETLVRIAGQLDRGVLGLLLEDLRLQQVADLPFTTEIVLHGGEERSLQREQLSRRHQLVRTDTGRLLQELAQRSRVDLVLENMTGNRLHTALTRNGGLDIFFPARQRWQHDRSGQSAARKPITRLGCVLAHTRQDPIVAETARLLQKAGLVEETYVLANGPLDRTQLDVLYQADCRVSVNANLHCNPATMSALIRQSPYDLLLLPRDSLLGIPADTLETALDKSSGPVLVIS